MSDVVSNEELNALAAEYVLGTLDYEERKGATALLEVDPTFRGIVRIWERRFGDLHLMVEAVQPGPDLWARIAPKTAGIEQVPLAIPSHADEAAALTAAAAPKPEVASKPEAASQPEATPMQETPSAPALAPTASESATPPAAPAAEAAAEPAPAATGAEAAAPGTEVVDAAPAEGTTPAVEATAPAAPTTPPADLRSGALAETELKLAELAALLPVNGAQTAAAPEAPEPAPDPGLHTHAPDLVPRGFVPPAPMSTRGAPTVVEVPVETASRGWMAATLAMALVAVALAGLISAWRFFPERLPAQLRANSVLNLAMPQSQQPQPKPRPKPAPFDE